MKTEKLILDYKRFSDKDLLMISSNVVTKLTGNVNFPETQPTLAAFTILQTKFSECLQKANGGDREQIALKNQAKEVLTDSMRLLAMNIDWLANGDKAKLLSCGFILASVGDRSTNLGQPKNFKISDTQSIGQLKLQCNRADNALSYVFEFAYEEDFSNNVWTVRTASTRSLVISGLISGKKVYARIKAVGRKGQESYTETLWRIVQ